MTNRVLIDTGPLVAICRSDDQHHALCVRQISALNPPLLTCWPVIVEAAYLLRHDQTLFQRLLESFDGGFLKLLSLEQSELKHLAAIARKYRNLESQIADAALVYLAEREKIDTVFTLDRRDFSVYRTAGNRPFRIMP